MQAIQGAINTLEWNNRNGVYTSEASRIIALLVALDEIANQLEGIKKATEQLNVRKI